MTGSVTVQVLGRTLRLQNAGDPEQLAQAIRTLEQTFQDMGRAYELKWGVSSSGLDTSTWLLMGALNLAHRVACLEQDKNQRTQDLEQTLSKLLDDVPDESTAGTPPLFGAEESES